MAKQTTVTITDDLDGSANAKEVSFSLDDKTWVIDLSAKNRAGLEKGAQALHCQGHGTGPPEPPWQGLPLLVSSKVTH